MSAETAAGSSSDSASDSASPPPIQVARAGRFGTKGLAVTFVSDETDAKTLNDVQDRFEVNVAELPEEIDLSTYSKLLPPLTSQWGCFLCGGLMEYKEDEGSGLLWSTWCKCPHQKVYALYRHLYLL